MTNKSVFTLSTSVLYFTNKGSLVSKMDLQEFLSPVAFSKVLLRSRLAVDANLPCSKALTSPDWIASCRAFVAIEAMLAFQFQDLFILELSDTLGAGWNLENENEN